MGARLHRHEERRARRSGAGRLQRDDLPVPAAVALRHPLADDHAVRDDHGADGRVGIRHPERGAGKLDRALEAHATAAARRR